MGNTYVFGLSAVDAAAQCPSAIRVFAVVYVTVAAEEAFSAECFYVDRNTVAGLDGMHVCSCLFDDAYHFMAYRNARNGTRYASVLDVEVAGADTSEGDAYQCVMWIFQLGNGFFYQGELALFDVGVC